MLTVPYEQDKNNKWVERNRKRAQGEERHRSVKLRGFEARRVNFTLKWWAKSSDHAGEIMTICAAVQRDVRSTYAAVGKIVEKGKLCCPLATCRRNELVCCSLHSHWYQYSPSRKEERDQLSQSWVTSENEKPWLENSTGAARPCHSHRSCLASSRGKGAAPEHWA